MRRIRVLVAVGSLLASMATSAHSTIDPIAGTFVNAAAGNGGLAWFVFYQSFIVR